ncbi:carboxymuconolactone decarboxylase family protein [Nocardia sp. NPDC052112]|uniref:carboxymuconolactone decarboxylase family protein n=1 Tax=Nocardia sp. NPDC052112 TaxID=3155646 RepID=UPI003420D70B
MARIAPVPRAEWSADMTAFIASFRNSVIGEEPNDNHQSGTNLLGTLAGYPALTKPFLSFNRHLLAENTLSARQRELVILRVAHLRQCAYEWAQHAILAARAGISPEEITRLAQRPDAPDWPPGERSLLCATGELLADGTIGEDTWRVLADEFDEKQLMDLVFTVGTYAMVAMALRSFGVEPETELLPHLPNSPYLGNGH